jgi:hypothetical protein
MLLLCQLCICQSQTETISIGSTQVYLGMPKGTVISQLGKGYLLEETDSPGTWLLHAKSGKMIILGGVTFDKADKLSEAWRAWTPEERNYTAAEVAEIMYKVVSKFVEEGNTKCTVGTLSSVQSSGPGGLELRFTDINCGARQLEIQLTWRAGQAYTLVSESLKNRQ